MKVEPQALDQLLHPIFDPKQRARAEVAAKGLPASPGAATGGVVFTRGRRRGVEPEGQARRPRAHGDGARRHPRHERRPRASSPPRAGMTSHAAVVGRQMGKPSVVGCGRSPDRRQGPQAQGRPERARRRRQPSRIDGATGDVILKELPTSPSEVLQVVEGSRKPETLPLYQKFEQLLAWADEIRRLGVRANADIPRDAQGGLRLRGARHRPMPHRAHVLRRGPAAPCGEDDPVGRAGPARPRPHPAAPGAAQGRQGSTRPRAAQGAGEGRRRSTARPSPTTRAPSRSSCPCSAPTSPGCSRRCTATR